jgi:hypothetical protein
MLIYRQQHVNNVRYTRYAESARINWAWNFAVHIDPKHKKEWSELWTPRGDGLILRSIKTDFKFVSPVFMHGDFQGHTDLNWFDSL